MNLGQASADEKGAMRSHLGKYEILRPLGRGAMGEVYLARDTVLGREVALKTIQASSAFGEEAKARFLREAQAMAALSHPSIVTIYDFGQAEDLSYLVMEYLEGETLEALLARKAPKEDLLEAFLQVCEGLGYAHERGIVHRDVKPANILVTRRGRHLHAKLMDFGVALVDQSTLTRQGVWMGTLAYMAPEYLDSGQASPSADLFAMGIILYEILSGGHKPFQGDTTTALLNAILRQPAPPLPPGSTLSPALLDVVHRALAKDPAQRYPTAEALAQAVQAGLTQPPAPHPPTPPLAPERTVGKGGQCMSLRVALRQVEPGGRIRLLPGIYREHLLLDRPITLVAEDPSTTILEGTQGPALRTQAEVHLEGIHLKGTSDHPALEVLAGRCSLKTCHLTGSSGVALHIRPGASGHLEGCEVSSEGSTALMAEGDVTLSGGAIQGGKRSGLRLGPRCRATLSEARIGSGSGVGLLAGPGSQVSLERVQIQDRRLGGVELDLEARLEAVDCLFQGSDFAGILALERGQVRLERCRCLGHQGAGLHVAEGSSAQVRESEFLDNALGLSLQGPSLATLDGVLFRNNHRAGLVILAHATLQARHCHILDGRDTGVRCEPQGRAILEACELAGHARTGAIVSPGGSLLLVRCTIRDGRDTGLLIYQDAEATLEQCVVHRNARAGILLARDASDPILRGANRIEDPLLRERPEGPAERLAPLKKR